MWLVCLCIRCILFIYIICKFTVSNNTPVFKKSTLASSLFALAIKRGFGLKLCDEEKVDYNKYGYSCLTRNQNVEIVRRLWWSLFAADVAERRHCNEYLLIREEDCRTCLPLENALIWSDNCLDISGWVHPDSEEAQKHKAILSSKMLFCPFIETTCARTLLLQLYKIERRLVEFNARQSRPDTAHVFHQATIELQQMESALEVFEKQLHPSIRHVVSLQVIPSGSESSWYWNALYLHMFLNSLCIQLQRANVSLDLKYGIKPVGEIQRQPVFIKFHTAADAITQILTRFEEQNPYFTFVTPIVGNIILETGYIHLVGTKLYPEPSFVHRKVDFVAYHIQILRKHGERVTASAHFANMLHKALVERSSSSRCPRKEFYKATAFIE